MKYITWFKELSKDSIPVAGGKGANLGEMFNLGLPVPPGFCITAQTYKKFIEDSGIKNKISGFLKKLDISNTGKLQEAADQIQKLITSTKMPSDIEEQVKHAYEILGTDLRKAADLVKSKEVFVAVRSSATAEDLPEASFAGQQATFLNIKGQNKVVKAVRDCWASLFTARAIYYRQKNKFSHDKVLISAIVQTMVNSEQSGVMFTVNPATNNPTEIVIEAIYGLGEYVVGGTVSPDLYIVDKNTRKIKAIEVKTKSIGLFRDERGNNRELSIPEHQQKQQVIPDTVIKELARYGTKIELHYGKPQDIEWAIEKGIIYIVQSRVVTTLKQNNKPAENLVAEKGAILLRGEVASAGIYTGKVKIVINPREINKVVEGDILVAHMTTPDWVPAMQKAGAIVTDEGGMTCHAAIVSREMGTPCIVGTEHGTTVLKEGQLITVDATKGLIYQGLVEIAQKKKAVNAVNLKTKTKIKVILDLPEIAARAAASGADGVGLVRAEIMIASGGIHPAEYIRQGKSEAYAKLLKDGIRKIAAAFKGRPVWVRCSDMRSDEYRNLQGGAKEPKETDPMIGWHGIRRLLDEPEILRAEFTAIRDLHYEGFKNVGVMLPFVIRVEELQQAKAVMDEVGLEPVKAIDFGVMIETPAACWIIEELCREGLSFVSFGTNDLTQLTLGIDRNNQKIAPLFDELHPAVLGEIAKVIKVCKKYGVQTSVCGQAGGKPEMAKFLVHQGIGSISTNIDAIDLIRQVVADTEKKNNG